MIELGVPSRKFGKRRGSASNMLSGSFVKVEGKEDEQKLPNISRRRSTRYGGEVSAEPKKDIFEIRSARGGAKEDV